MFRNMHMVEKDVRTDCCESVDHVYDLLNDCLLKLDTMHMPVAAAHLSACLETLKQNVTLG